MRLRQAPTVAALAATATVAGPTAGQITMTFEEFLGSDVAPIATFYDGITFESGGSGSDWVARDGSTGNYNMSSWPSGDVLGSDGDFWIFDLVAATTALDATGNDGTIRFDNADATFVEVGYCAANDFFLEAYDADDNLLDLDSGPPNLRIGNGNENGPGLLRVDWDGETHIAYVIVHDEGNFWILDNITTDATGIIIDCNGNGVPDDEDIAQGTSEDCNGNEIPDECDIDNDFSQDQNQNGIPDECEPDCNDNGVPDDLDIDNGTSTDFNDNGIPDECESEVDFGEPQEFDADGAPNIEATGDLDGNGTLDVVTAIPGESVELAGNAQVFLNLGTDGFGEWLGLIGLELEPVGREPSGVAVGLFNNDVHLDVAVSNAGDDNVSILINQGLGDATFLPQVTVAVGARPSAITSGEFTGDAFTDLAVTNEDDNTVLILENDGNGNFTPLAGPVEQGPGGFPVTAGPIALQGDDFDNNKCPDLAGAGQGAAAATGANGSVFVMLGQGGGNYAAAVPYPIGVDPKDISTCDLNNDGCVDIVAVNAGDGTVSILINRKIDGLCTGDFFPAFTVPVGALPASIDAVDLNGDGHCDLAVVAEDEEIGPAVQVLQNSAGAGGGFETGSGPVTFGPLMSFGVGADPNFVVSGDLDDNGIFDLVTVNQTNGTGGSVTVLLGDPNPIALQVLADIRPGECPNPLNRGSHGIVTVALVGTTEFNVTEVDVSSVLISRDTGVGTSASPNEGPPGPHTTIGDVATPFGGALCDCHDQEGDGTPDLTLKFRTDDLVALLDLDMLDGGDEITLKVTGTLNDGTPFEARDCIVIVPVGGGPGQLLVESNAPGVFVDVTPDDDQADAGGFSPFDRWYPQSTVVTLTAPLQHQGWLFVGWNVDDQALLVNGGGSTLLGGSTIDLAIDNDFQTAEAVYIRFLPQMNGSPGAAGSQLR